MVNYNISHHNASFYDRHSHDITLGAYSLNGFTNEEIIKYTSDIIIHEHIHKIIHEWFNSTLCKLFDAIAYKLWDDKLQDKYIRHNIKHGQYEKWETFIKRKSFKFFLEYIHVDNDNINQAYIICGGK